MGNVTKDLNHSPHLRDLRRYMLRIDNTSNSLQGILIERDRSCIFRIGNFIPFLSRVLIVLLMC